MALNIINKLRLGDYVKIRTGKLDANAASENGKYPFFTCAIEPLKIDKYTYECECVLVAGNGDLNVKYYNGKFDAYQRTYIIESIDDSKLYVPYLYRFLDEYVKTLRAQSIGGVIKYIKLGNLTEAKIYLPDLNEQKRICNNLSQLDELIESVNCQLEDLDLLVKSRFIELFGDPVSNPKNWAKKAIKEFATDVRYGTSKPAIEGGRYPYLRMNNLTYDGRLDLSDLKYIDIPDNELEKCVVKYGDILFNRTNSIELVGKTCLFEFNYPMVIAGYIIRIRLNDRVTPLYLTTYMNLEFMKKQLRNMAKGAVNQANINAQEMQSIIVPVPPLDLQNQFADFVEEVNKSKLEVQKSLEELETLKKSLMQQYFG